jgi:threonine dehydrogenase-like Zn-dependent dehydrogenase
MQFRAAILEAPGQTLVIDTVETGPLRPQDVLVRMGAAGICHTDLEVIAGQLVYPMPVSPQPRLAIRIAAPAVCTGRWARAWTRTPRSE